MALTMYKSVKLKNMLNTQGQTKLIKRDLVKTFESFYNYIYYDST